MFLRACALALVAALAALPQTNPSVHGMVVDAVNRPVPGATVTLRDAHGALVASVRTDDHGRYRFEDAGGAATVAASAPGLAPTRELLAEPPSHARTGGAPADRGERAEGGRRPPEPRAYNLVLGLAAAQSTINVVAAGVPLPEAQLGNATSSLPRSDLDALHLLQAAGALRLQPGVAVIQTGQPGSVSSVFLRGAPSDFTKVLLDGVPIQRIDLGGYDFANLVPAGLEEVSILRGPDSVIYGSDAAAGVIALRTRSGRDLEAPELDVATAAGAYATLAQSDQLLGRAGALDYALRYGYTATHNQEPNAKFRNNTYGANLGWQLAPTLDARFTLQRLYSDVGQPGELLFDGLPQHSFKHQAETYGDLTVRQQPSPAWSQKFELTQAGANLFSEDAAPAGIPDGFGDFDGLPVTIHGANGFSASGQAVLSFGGTFPQTSPSDTLRRDANYESAVQIAPAWRLITGYRYYNERGLSSNVALSRHDHGVYTMLTGGVGNRLFGTVGLSGDRNTPFGSSASPQASLAFYPRLGRSGFWDETRLRASGGTGLKDPGLELEEFSLFQELLAAPGGAGLIRQLGVQPLRPERSRDFDAGVDQYIAGGAGTLSLTAFDQRYYDLVEDIPPTAFPSLGIPQAVAQTAIFGGEFNSQTQRSRGVELAGDFRLPRGWRVQGNYTAQQARVLRSFSFDAQSPTINPNLPGIPIGAFAPLVGGRPFRVPPQSASAQVAYEHGRFAGVASTYYLSRRDDSTFLTDANFGNTLLLPNKDLDPAFGILNLSGTWRASSRWQVLAAVDNATDRAYQEVLGFPGPRITARLGLRFTWNPPLP